MFRRRKPELFNAEKEAEYIDTHNLHWSAYKRKVMDVCDGCPVLITASGLSKVIGKDKAVYHLWWRKRVGASNEIK